MFSRVPSCAFSGFWTLTWKLTQDFDLIYNIGKSDWKILRNIMKTAQDSYTITIKQCILKNFKLIKLKMAAYRPLFTSTGLILRNIMNTAQNSYTINIKSIVRFQERMHLEKFQVDKIQNGRLSAIIHLDRPDIGEYHENRSRYLHHYYKTNCKVSGEDAFWKKSTCPSSKWQPIGHYSLSHGRYLVNRAKWLDHYYKTKCVISGEDASWKNLTR